MTTQPSKYQPISCEFHDLLEVHATVRSPTQVRFRETDGDVQVRNAIITDVFARDGAEYVSLSSGETVRLDRLLEVGGAKLSDY